MKINIYDTPELTIDALTRRLIRLIEKSENNEFNIALSGGETAISMYHVWINQYKNLIPWDRLRFYWVDERCVAPDNEESNFYSAVQALFKHLAIPNDHIHPINGEEDPKSEALRYGALLTRNVPVQNNTPVFDCIILGLGADGHTASIFPTEMNLLDNDEIYAAATNPYTKQARITMTGKVINNAKAVFFVVMGSKKSIVMKDLYLHTTISQSFPAAYIETDNGITEFYIDKEAGVNLD